MKTREGRAGPPSGKANYIEVRDQPGVWEDPPAVPRSDHEVSLQRKMGRECCPTQPSLVDPPKASDRSSHIINKVWRR